MIRKIYGASCAHRMKCQKRIPNFSTPKISNIIENQPNKLNIDFIEHMEYYILKSDVIGFDPDTYFEGPKVEDNGICFDEECQKLGYCKLKNEDGAKCIK